MCGIVGFSQSQNIDQETIVRQMMDSIAHRGPDDEGTFIHNQVAFGHRRLSIIDLEHGQQPMQSGEGRFTIIFNGEIYNYLELRQDLVVKGHPLKTFSDTEVLLYMFIQYREKMLNRVNGMFAFAIYDREEDTIFLARDHFGIKPLYYFCQDGLFVFASEIKALFKYPGVESLPNLPALNEYVTFQFLSNSNTLFQKIQRLEPAHYMILRGQEIVENIEYWSIDYTIDDSLSGEQYASELLVLLENSLSIQVRSDVPIGAHLSGGMDSSLIAVLASKSYYGELKTFTGAFEESADYDESPYARIVSDYIKSDHFTIYPNSQDFIDNFEKLVYHLDEPTAGPGVFPQYMVSKLAAEQVKVVLGGQGGDEIFGGYVRYAIAYLEQCLKGAIFETQEEDSHIVTLSSLLDNLPLLRKYVPLLKSQFSDGLFDPMDRRYFRLVNRSLGLNRVYHQDFLEKFNPEEMYQVFQDVFNKADSKSYFNKMTYYDIKTLLPALLQVEDRVSMAVSLESRVPLLDSRIMELTAKMPPNLKFAGGKTKNILHQAVKNILPQEIINRTDKMGFPTPLNEWMNGPLRDYVLDILTSQKSKERNILDTSKVESFMSSNSSFDRTLWGALNLEVWFRTFIDK